MRSTISMADSAQSYLAGCSLAWSILGGMIGQISLGHGAFAALGAYIGAVLYSFLDISPWISMIIAFFVVGIVMTLLLSPCFGLKGAYFSLATIAFGEAFRNIFINWEFVGSGQGMILKIVREESFWMLAFRNKTHYFYVSSFMALPSDKAMDLPSMSFQDFTCAEIGRASCRERV